MAQPTNLYDTYDTTGIREDLVDVIYNISPEDTPILSAIPRAVAKSTKHEWQIDALAAPGAGSNRAITETILKTVIEEVYTAGGDTDVLVVPPKVKQTISGFTASTSTPRFSNAGDRTFDAAIDVYVSDFGSIQIVPNRVMAGLETLFLLQTDMAAAAYLRDFQVNDLAKTGDSEKKQLLVEFTLEVRNEAAHGILLDITE